MKMVRNNSLTQMFSLLESLDGDEDVTRPDEVISATFVQLLFWNFAAE